MRFSGAVIGSALLAAARSSALSVSVPPPAAEGAACTATVLALPEVLLGPTSTIFPSTSTAVRAIDCGGCAAVATSEIRVGVLPVVDFTATVTAEAPATATSFTCAEAGLPTPAVQPDGPLKFLVPVPVADTPAGTFGKLKPLEVRKLEGYWVGGGGGAGGKSAQGPASPQYGGESPNPPTGSGPIAPSPGSPAGFGPLAPPSGPDVPTGSGGPLLAPAAPSRPGPLAGPDSPGRASPPRTGSQPSPSAPTGFTTLTGARPEHTGKHHRPKLPHATWPHANSTAHANSTSHSNSTSSQAIWSAPPAATHTISPLGAQQPPTCTRSLTLAPALPRSTLTVYPATVTHTSRWDCGGCAVVYSTLRITPTTPVAYVKTKTARKPSVVTELMCTDTPRAPRPTAAYDAAGARAVQRPARANDPVDLVDEVELQRLRELGYTFF